MRQNNELNCYRLLSICAMYVWFHCHTHLLFNISHNQILMRKNSLKKSEPKKQLRRWRGGVKNSRRTTTALNKFNATATANYKHMRLIFCVAAAPLWPFPLVLSQTRKNAVLAWRWEVGRRHATASTIRNSQCTPRRAPATVLKVVSRIQASTNLPPTFTYETQRVDYILSSIMLYRRFWRCCLLKAHVSNSQVWSAHFLPIASFCIFHSQFNSIWRMQRLHVSHVG